LGVWGGLIIGDDSGGGGVLAATTAVLFILLYFMCEAIAVAGVLGMVGSNLWYVAGCEIGGGRGWVQVVGLKVGKLILLRLLPTLRLRTKKNLPIPPRGAQCPQDTTHSGKKSDSNKTQQDAYDFKKKIHM
jgi:hypothetical protein